MRVMPANSTGWFWHSLARETGMLGHLLGPGHHGWPGPYPWFPYAMDNDAFRYWDMAHNAFDFERWDREGVPAWLRLLNWERANTQRALWAIVPDVPGNWTATRERWELYAPHLVEAGVPLAVAVQDGAEPHDVLGLDPFPEVICVGGTTDWKWATAAGWCRDFPRVHVLRVNGERRLDECHAIGAESCDGTGWGRGDHGKRTGQRVLEAYCRKHGRPVRDPLWPHTCRETIRGTGQGALL